LTKVQGLLVVWLTSLAVSAGLRQWGVVHPDPLQAPLALVVAVVLAPSLGFTVWLLGAEDRGKRESFD